MPSRDGYIGFVRDRGAWKDDTCTIQAGKGHSKPYRHITDVACGMGHGYGCRYCLVRSYGDRAQRGDVWYACARPITTLKLFPIEFHGTRARGRANGVRNARRNNLKDHESPNT